MARKSSNEILRNLGERFRRGYTSLAAIAIFLSALTPAWSQTTANDSASDSAVATNMATPSTEPDSVSQQNLSAPQDSSGPKTGEFEITFSRRSPLSVPEQIARRTNKSASDLNSDYVLADQPFLVAVPPDYDPSTPCGIVVYLGSDSVDSLPHKLIPILAGDHLIFIAPRRGTETTLHKVGLAFDAIFNLSADYSIDPKRIYLATTSECSTIAMVTPDVFTGQIMISNFNYFHTIMMKGADGKPGFHKMDDPPPPRELLPLAKQRAYVLALPPVDASDPRPFVATEMQRDGFKHVLQVDVTNEDIKYPHLRPEWFEKAIGFLDDAAGNGVASTQSVADLSKPPVTAVAGNPKNNAATDPQTEPTLSRAEQLLNLAQAFIASGKPELARPKLFQIITKYPNDPNAKKAKQLLQEIGMK